MSATYTLGPSSDTEITILPDYDFNSRKAMNKSSMRSKNGKLYSYKWFNTKKINFSAHLFSNSDAAIVNSWWSTQTKLIFFKNIDNIVTCTSVMLTNNSTPFQQYTKPYVTKLTGVIELEEYL